MARPGTLIVAVAVLILATVAHVGGQIATPVAVPFTCLPAPIATPIDSLAATPLASPIATPLASPIPCPAASPSAAAASPGAGRNAGLRRDRDRDRGRERSRGPQPHGDRIAPSANGGSADSGGAVDTVTEEWFVEIANFAFIPNSLEIQVGDTVTWTNLDRVGHRVRSQPEFDSRNLREGETYSFTFLRPGRFDYRDPSYPNMEGTIRVRR
jgi:plastocyanin